MALFKFSSTTNQQQKANSKSSDAIFEKSTKSNKNFLNLIGEFLIW